MTTGLTTRSVFERYLHCRYLAHLRLGGREGVRSDWCGFGRSFGSAGRRSDDDRPERSYCCFL
jgi:hypothetical protein